MAGWVVFGVRRVGWMDREVGVNMGEGYMGRGGGWMDREVGVNMGEGYMGGGGGWMGGVWG